MHYKALVILTPECNLDLSESLEEYYEYKQTDRYCVGEVDDNGKQYFIETIKNKHDIANKSFDELYNTYGNEVDDDWEYDKEQNKWFEYSKKNPNSKYDYFAIGESYYHGITTINGEETDECLLKEMDIEQYDCNAIIIDGKWYERDLTDDINVDRILYHRWKEKINSIVKTLPENSQCFNIDYHV